MKEYALLCYTTLAKVTLKEIDLISFYDTNKWQKCSCTLIIPCLLTIKSCTITMDPVVGIDPLSFLMISCKYKNWKNVISLLFVHVIIQLKKSKMKSFDFLCIYMVGEFRRFLPIH